MESCIYIIRNTTNDKVYVGSTIDFKSRMNKHYYLLRKNKHHNDHLQNSYNTYGEKNFEASIIENLDYPTKKELEKNLLIREDYWIDKYKSLDENFGYNIETAIRTSISEYTKKKISQTLTGTSWEKTRWKTMGDSYSKKLTLEDARTIRILKEEGMEKKLICSIFDISERSYYYVLSNKYHKEY